MIKVRVMYPNPVVPTRPPDFARGASLTAAVAVAVLTLLLAPANAVPGVEQPAAGASLEFNKEDGTLYIDWSGPIVAGMAEHAAVIDWPANPKDGMSHGRVLRQGTNGWTCMPDVPGRPQHNPMCVDETMMKWLTATSLGRSRTLLHT
jgi:hypothetical protein